MRLLIPDGGLLIDGMEFPAGVKVEDDKYWSQALMKAGAKRLSDDIYTAPEDEPAPPAWYVCEPLTTEDLEGLVRNAEAGIAVNGCYFRMLKTLCTLWPPAPAGDVTAVTTTTDEGDGGVSKPPAPGDGDASTDVAGREGPAANHDDRPGRRARSASRRG